ncbi:MAG TPA: hypothetical protein VEJ46_18050 [Candidatus Acidoferrum sp.]|nr:hypothetical protein [Candidatus Acidoferrum sp.]
MTILPLKRRIILQRLAALLLGLLAVRCAPTFGQKKAERFWLAGRYDGNRVVIYFDAVKFEGTMHSNARKIAPPVADAFFEPVQLSASYLARFQNTPEAERFAIGDRYDVLLGNGLTATIKLTTLVGCETDEGVGNDSFIGALGTIEDENLWGLFTRNYYAVRRHQEAQPPGSVKYAVLLDEPARFDVEARLAELLTAKMKTEATDAERKTIGNVSPALKVQPFQVADGSLRYYARAEWDASSDATGMSSYLLAAWVAPLPELRVLSVEKRTSPYGGIGDGLPDLLNVIDLGNGKAGVILDVRGEDSTELILAEYQDGLNVREMRVIQSIGAGE